VTNGGCDLAVIGGGPGGYTAAAYAAGRGMRVACVEMDAVGGVCLHRGCIPSKTLIRSAELLDLTRASFSDFGVKVRGEVSLDFGQAMGNKAKVVDRLHRGTKSLLKTAGVAVIQGRGRLTSEGRVAIASPDGGLEIDAKHVLVATGSAPRSIPGVEVDGDRIITSDHALFLDSVPRSVVILGAGAIGMEFAYIMSTFGASVTVLELLPRALPLEDEEISAALQRLYRDRCEIVCGARVTAAVKTDSGVKVTAGSADGSERTFEAEKLLVAVGRRPLSEDLGLEECGVRVERGYVQCDPVMLTDNPRIYAIGDLVGRLPLAHTASMEGHVAVDAMLGDNPAPLDYTAIPKATYCIPEVASVGLTEAAARDRGDDVATAKLMFRAIGKAVASGEYEGLCKIVADAGTGRLLGAHILGPHATELVAEAGLALSLQATVRDLARTVHAHPTLSEILRETAAQLLH